MNVLVAISPIALLIYLMVKRNSWPAHLALPLVAALLYGLKLGYFGSDLRLTNAAVIDGALTAWTPILVIWGAIFLFRSMEVSGSLKVIRGWLNSITPNRVAQVMIIGWAFAFLVEGASGFGTPAALAAPLLVGLGFKPLQAAILTLMMNSVPVSFGAVGTPTWFGLGHLGLSETQLIEIGFKTSLIHFAAAFIIPILALRMIFSKREIKENLTFVYLSILSCTVPYIWLASSNYEFPALIAGAIGLLISILLAEHKVGLKEKKQNKPQRTYHVPEVIRAFFPLWGVILVLVVTRLNELGIKAFLTAKEPRLLIEAAPLADIGISRSLVLQLDGILGTSLNFSHALLYVPSLIPFFLVGLLTFWLLKKPGASKAWSQSWEQIKKPIIALIGALIFVKLLSVGNGDALTVLIGNSLANIFGQSWQFGASYLGALGSFFSGSNTVSNLTFGGIQLAIAEDLGLNVTTILALQSAGGAMGNMVCINNIVAVCAVLGLTQVEGAIIKKTVTPMITYGVIAAGVGLLI